LRLLPAPHCAAISFVALPTSASTGASDQFYFVWNSSKGESTGSDHLLTNKRRYNLIHVLRRSDLRLLPAPHCAAISFVALPTSASTGASDQFYFVWDSSKGESTGSDHLLMSPQHYILVCVRMRSNLEFGLAASTTLGRHIVCSIAHIGLNRC
jgi:hypothetical protein